ncbi:hypothetical protein ACERNI_07340 [Camelimonas sp. ID_303_24]
MHDKPQEGRFLENLGVIETIESDNIVRWDGARLYVECDVYHNGQLVHSKYRRNVSKPVAQHLLSLLQDVIRTN